MCAMPIIERPKKTKPAPRWITLDEANRLIASASDHMRPLLVFLLYVGARAGEALWLDWSNVDLARAHVTFPETKNGEARSPIRTPTPQRVAGSRQVSRGHAVGPASRVSVRTIAATPGRPGINAANRDLGALQRLGGWKTITMVMRYTHVNVEELQHTIDRLPTGGNLGEGKNGEATSA
jgi:integrase